jgi:phosphoribosylglycinamide formyltransferase-1
MNSKLKIGVLASGNGTNLQAIIDGRERGELSAEVVCVITNKANAFALERAKNHGIPAIHLNHKDFTGREAYDAATVEVLKTYGVELVVLAGYMRIITRVLLNAFPMAVMNIHPALLPSFPGLDAQKQALDHGAKLTGCTVHFVDEGTDTGPIIIQAAVPILADDTVETLSQRIHIQEHRIYPQAIQLFATGRLTVSGRRVISTGEHAAIDASLINPSA